MSNVVIKGDVIQNLGEYLPNPYIERVSVQQTESRRFTLTIHCSLIMLVPDDYQRDLGEIIQNNINEINVYGILGARDGTQLKKQEIINRITSQTILNSDIHLLESGGGISDRIQLYGDYQDDLYDEQDRRILKVNFPTSITFEADQSMDARNLYLYVFSSTLGKSAMSETASNLLYLNTSNIAYEKIFSPGLLILREEQVIYVDRDGNKYGRTPLLSTNRNFYKTEVVSRESIIDKFNSLVKRFEGGSNGPLIDSVNSIKTVLNKEADTENLLVELDKVRRSFPNKTNNNPVGNLYAAFSRLLLNTNSVFTPSQIVTKQNYLTGKVRYVQQSYSPPASVLEPVGSIDYIPESMFFVNRERLSEDENYDWALNKGVFFVRFEEWLKRESEISSVLDTNKLYEIVSGTQSNTLRRILLSCFRVANIDIIKRHKNVRMQTHTLDYGYTFRAERSNYRKFAPQAVLDINQTGTGSPVGGELVAEDDEGTYLVGAFFREYNFGFTDPAERLLCYTFQDIDAFTGIYEANELETVGGMSFEYEVNIKIRDQTREFFRFLYTKFNQLFTDFREYKDFANETCSYNNIDNRFNDFFINGIRDYEFQFSQSPWEEAPAMYSLMVYLFTDEFNEGGLATSIRYSKNLSSQLSPENVDLNSLTYFLQLMEDLRNNVLAPINSSFGPSQVLGLDLEASMTKEVILTPINFGQVLAEARAEYEYENRDRSDENVVDEDEPLPPSGDPDWPRLGGPYLPPVVGPDAEEEVSDQAVTQTAEGNEASRDNTATGGGGDPSGGTPASGGGGDSDKDVNPTSF